MTVEFMSRLLIVAILATSTAPRYAQGAQPDVAQLKTVQEKDRKKAEELWQANGSESGPPIPRAGRVSKEHGPDFKRWSGDREYV
jgi:hypothetical protein